MHRAFLIDDVVHTVLQSVKPSAKDLINFACTSSAFSSPALDILWRVQPNLGPLVMCLPQDTWEIKDDNIIHISRKPLPTEWERVRLNAFRIRRLVSNARYTRSTRPPKVHNCVMQPLFALFPPASLFPNLHDLDFSAVFNLRGIVPNLQLSLLRQFLSPRLAFLAFHIPWGILAKELEMFMDILSSQASGLQQLVISSEKYGASHRQIQLPLAKMQRLNALGVIRNACLSKRSLADIAHLRFLHVLALNLDGCSNTLTDSHSDDITLELNHLEHLTLDATSIQHCTSFLLRVCTPRLSCLNIKYNKHACSAEVNAFFLTLHTTCPIPESLEILSVHCYISISDMDRRLHDLLPSHIFRPLLKFRRLGTVKMLEMGNYCLDDDFMEDVAVAWPDIHELQFSSKQMDLPLVTFSGVLSLATQCRSLRILRLTFNAIERPSLPQRREGVLDENQGLWPKQTALQILHIGYSKVLTTALVPFVLAVVFPNLRDISYQITGTSDDTHWKQAAGTFRKLRNNMEKDPDMAARLPRFVSDMLRHGTRFTVNLVNKYIQCISVS